MLTDSTPTAVPTATPKTHTDEHLAYCRRLAERNGRPVEHYLAAFDAADAAEADYVNRRMARYKDPRRINVKTARRIRFAAQMLAMRVYRETLESLEVAV